MELFNILLILFILFVTYKFLSYTRQPTMIEKYYQGKEVEGEFKFHSKVVGVTYESKDGHKRQKLCKKLKKGDILFLIPDRKNRHDPNAITVYNRSEIDIGYLPSEHAASLRHQIDSGDKFFAQVGEVTGGGWFKNYGVNLNVYKVKSAN